MTKKSPISYFSLQQSNLIAGQEAFYTMMFVPETRLPSTAAFRIKTPREIVIVRGDKNNCYIDSTKVVKNVCNYRSTDTLEIKRGLRHMTQNDYYGQLTIVFEAINPPSNFY